MRIDGRVIAGLLATGLLVVACGNQQEPGGSPGETPTSVPPTTMPSSPTGTPSAPVGTPSSPGTTPPTRTVPTTTPSAAPTTTPSAVPSRPVRIVSAMLLTGQEVAKADPKRNWAATSGVASTPICGRLSTRGDDVAGALNRNFSNDLDASGGHWLTRYETRAQAKAAYEQIVATVRSCKAAKPAPTHARKITENRRIGLGDATTILRWYDYPLPNDPGSEAGGFPYAVTLKGTVVSVTAFREMGPGVKPANFERIARAAAARLP